MDTFAVVIMAHLKTRATRHDPDERLGWKLTLAKGLYGRGYERDDVLELFRFIDWLLHLPDELAKRFTQQLIEYEAAMSTPYITSVERQGIEKGVLQGLQRGLDAERTLLVRQVQRRFDASTAEQLVELLQTVEDPDRLTDIGEWVIESKTGPELIERVQELLKNGCHSARVKPATPASIATEGADCSTPNQYRTWCWPHSRTTRDAGAGDPRVFPTAAG